MTTPNLYQTQARYSRVMNRKLYAVAANIPDAERRADLGAFFKSVHGTLNHVLWGDRAWFNRFTGREDETPAMGAGEDQSFDEMRAARESLDQRIIDWTDTLEQVWLDRDYTWYANSDGKTRVQPVWLLVTHMFNHGVHHRGQVTTLLTQMGYDVGVTDLPRLDLGPRLKGLASS